MQNKYFSVVLSISDGESSLPIGYIVSVADAARFDQTELEATILNAIAADQGFSHNGEYYETVGMTGVTISRINEICEEDYVISSRIFKNLTCHAE